jgi:hypothetical protein
MAQRIEEKVASEELSGLKGNDLKKKYAEVTGAYYENGKIYSDSSMETELDLSADTVCRAIATNEVTAEMTA